MTNGGGTTWFEAIMGLLYKEMFKAGSPINLPNIILNGYTGDGLKIPPMDGTQVGDWSIADLKVPITDSCTKGISNGNADFKATQQTLSGFHTIVQNGPLAFSSQDQSIVINLSLQSLVLAGNFTSDQNCSPNQGTADWTETCSGTFNCTLSNKQLSMKISVSVGEHLAIKVEEIDFSAITADDLTWSATCNGCKPSQRMFFQSLLTLVEAFQPGLLSFYSAALNKFLNDYQVKSNIASIVNAQLAKI